MQTWKIHLFKFTTLNLSQNRPNLLIQGSHWSNYDFTIVLKSHCVEIKKSFLNYANLNDTWKILYSGQSNANTSTVMSLLRNNHRAVEILD